MKCPLCKVESKEVRKEGNLVYVKCMNKDCNVTVYECVSKSAYHSKDVEDLRKENKLIKEKLKRLEGLVFDPNDYNDVRKS